MEKKWRGLPCPLEHVTWHSGVTVLFGPLSALPPCPSKTCKAVQWALLAQAGPPSAATVNFFHMPGLLLHQTREDGERYAVRVVAGGGEGRPAGMSEGWWERFFGGCLLVGGSAGGSQRQHVLACWGDGRWHQEKSIQRSQPSLIIRAAELPAPFKIFQEGFSPKIELKMCWALLRISSVWALWEVSGRL